MEKFTLAAAAAAFVAGLSGSLHCAGMCGPLACAPLPAAGAARRLAAAGWHVGRLLAYASVGAVAGALGAALQWLVPGFLRVAPWLVVAGLLLSAFELSRFVPALPGLKRMNRAVGSLAANFSPPVRAAMLGAMTPLLPCGLLYGAVLSAAGVGRAADGALVLTAFGLGAVPAIGVVQGLSKHLQRLGPSALLVRRGVMVLAAAVVAWRALHGQAADAPVPPECH